MDNPNKNTAARDLNGGDWYWISRAVLLSHGQTLKPAGVAVYNVLAAFANSKTQTCFPAHKTIAKITGTSKRTVSEKIRRLEELKLIYREKQKDRNIYHLLECGEKKKSRPSGYQMALLG